MKMKKMLMMAEDSIKQNVGYCVLFIVHVEIICIKNKLLEAANRHFQNKCDIVEEQNSSRKHGITAKFFSLMKRNLMF